ncbi:MAG TPA: NAD(P)/FAD-dependent oxidoreductase [Candidatus Paceibacterota bacterium]|nr:NAD(P)/FAD-dependent oxidoreductase [Candidatus Paceibacterota bacterium]
MSTEKKEYFDVAVLGGGASGMMAAGVAASRGKKVVLLEKNKELGKKLKITGGGRCNITNAEFDSRAFLSHFKKAEKFLHSPLSKFGVQDTFDFFAARGLPLVVQARKRAFPKTENAHDVAKVLEIFLKHGGVAVRTGHKVISLKTEDGKITGVVTTKGEIVAEKFILATGGQSHTETGSTGDGFAWLSQLGHTIKSPSPNIVPLKVPDTWVHALQGVSLSFMRITFYLDEKKQFSKTGKILFTHFGLSGPLILNSAYEVGELLEGGTVTAKIDLFPDTDLGSLGKQVLRVFDQNKNKQFKNVFPEIAPRGTSDVFMQMLSLDPEKRVHSITVEERKQIVHLLKALPLAVSGLMGFDRAVISDGGVILEEVDTKTLRSKLYENLYLTGDILHINRPSGGYSLQLCWTTGFVAGSSV